MSSGEEQSNEEEMEAESKIEKLSPESRQVNVTVKVVSKSPAREVTSRSDGSVHRVADALVGDETGCILMTLWDEDIDKINEADMLSIRNGHVSLFRGSMRLNTGKYGSFKHSEKTVTEVNTENNLSSRRFEEERPSSSFFRPTYGGRGKDYGRRRGRGYRRGY